MDLIIAPLSKQHERKAFDCGEASLNHYLDRYASQDVRRRVNRVFIASPPGEPRLVIGYYSLVRVASPPLIYRQNFGAGCQGTRYRWSCWVDWPLPSPTKVKGSVLS